MQYITAVAALAGVAAASVQAGGQGWGQGDDSWGASASWAPSNASATASDVYVTEVVTAFTTYCPYATQLTIGGQTHTISSATTLTISSCPGGCTVTHPASSPVSSSSPSVSTAPVGPVTVPSSTAPYTVPANGTTPAVGPTGTGAPSKSASTSAPVYTGAASKAQAVGAGLLALVGLAAAL